jgi:ABC-type branched-subunit amino acid transport system ATPase component
VVFEDLTIEENLEVCRASGVRITQDLVPSVLGARLRERAGSLSGGERQLLGMAMVRAASPRLMMLDEPCAALTQDASSRLLQRLLPTSEGNGAAVLLIEQRISNALRIASRVICLENGGVAYSGPPSELVFGPTDPSSPRHGAVAE